MSRKKQDALAMIAPTEQSLFLPRLKSRVSKAP